MFVEGKSRTVFFRQTLLFTAFIATIQKVITYVLVSTWSKVSSGWEQVPRFMQPWSLESSDPQHHCDNYYQLVGEREVEGEDRVIATSQTFKVVIIIIIIIMIMTMMATKMTLRSLMDCLHLWRLTGAKSTRWQWTDQRCFHATKVRSTFFNSFYPFLIWITRHKFRILCTSQSSKNW